MPRLKHAAADLADLRTRAAFHRAAMEKNREIVADLAAQWSAETVDRYRRRANAHRVAFALLTTAAVLADRDARYVEIGAAAVAAGDVDGNAAEDPETGLVDMLACVMHWAARHDVDFDHAIDLASMHFTAEQNGSL